MAKLIKLMVVTDFIDGTGRRHATTEYGAIDPDSVESILPNRAMVIDNDYRQVVKVRTKTGDEILAIGYIDQIAKLLDPDDDTD